MELQDRVVRLEDEVKVLKNEVQTVLLDIRESYLNRENPFNPEVSSPTLHAVAAAVTGQNAFAGVGGGKPPKEIKKEPETEEPEEEEMEEEARAEVKPAAPEAKVATASEATASEEVKEALRSEEEPEVTDMERNHNGRSNGNGKMDLVTIAGLARWVDGAVGVLGRTRTETVLDFAELTGHLPSELKNTLVRLVGRMPEDGNGNGNGHSHTAHELITSLIELEGLLGMNNKSDEITLLAMVCQEVAQ